jgi:UDP-N-acetyl-D-mannosaminuronic acid transferase (WecB/TagA/CpsF family)
MGAKSIRLQPDNRYQHILGIRFFTGDARSAVELGSQGGLTLAPAAPALCELGRDQAYRQALQQADLVITDSGFLVLLWNAMTRNQIERVSGLKYLKLLLSRADFKEPGASFWVMPSRSAMERNITWLQQQGCQLLPHDCYVAPQYAPGPISDKELLERINELRPRHVVVCVGGGVQEKLGLYLKRGCASQPAIHCIGAAIGFLTGDQVRIPEWADQKILGWFFRCISDPRKFVPRYVRALELPFILWRYRTQMPGPIPSDAPRKVGL